MSKLIPLLSLVLFTSAFANDKVTQSPTSPPKNSVHRYLVERTFPAGALKGLAAATYEGPSEAAIRKAAELNKLPVDSIIEVPVTLSPK
jgi:hypothetical protein